VTIGVAAAIGAGRMMAGLLFETRATDPTTLAVVACGTMLVAVAAGVVPARRATRVDPIIALRND
jgi:ABC-type antimicrobial peptide transport system permease subunit